MVLSKKILISLMICGWLIPLPFCLGETKDDSKLSLEQKLNQNADFPKWNRKEKRVSIIDAHLEENELVQIVNDPDLNYLYLDGHYLRPSDLLPLLDLPPVLKTLIVSDTPRISDESVLGKIIENQVNLERLVLWQIPVSTETIEHIATLPRLKKLTLWHTSHVTGNDLYALSQSKTLQESLEVLILVDGYDFSDFDDFSFMDAPEKEMEDEDGEFEAESIRLMDFMGDFKNLRILSMIGDGWSIPWEDPYHFLHALTKLEKLLIPADRDGFTDEVLEKYISQMSDLKILVLNGTGVTDQGMASLLTLPKLKELSIIGTKVSDEGLKILAEHPTLEMVAVDYFDKPTPITHNGVKYLSSKIEQRHPSDNNDWEFPHVIFGVMTVVDDDTRELDD